MEVLTGVRLTPRQADWCTMARFSALRSGMILRITIGTMLIGLFTIVVLRTLEAQFQGPMLYVTELVAAIIIGLGVGGLIRVASSRSKRHAADAEVSRPRT